MSHEDIIATIYEGFNRRDIPAVFAYFHPQVAWPNGWEGGYVHGHDEVREYWTRQWQDINPIVKPVTFTKLADGRLQITVHQFATSLATGEVLFDGNLLHIYEFENDLIKKMVIENTDDHATVSLLINHKS